MTDFYIGENHRQPTTIDILPDDVLLGIFGFCEDVDDRLNIGLVWDWHFLVHICRRWRQIIFASPHRLNLKILCTNRTPVRKYLGIWPAFPIVIDYDTFYSESGPIPPNEDNIVAAFDSENLDRVCFVGLCITGSQLKKIAAVMEEPFPALKHLQIVWEDEYASAPVLPDGFLGGSAPCLQKIVLSGVPYPALPTLLLSTSGLLELDLHSIPPISYISPEAMVASLAALPRLERFSIDSSTTSRPDRISSPPITQSVLPALACFRFRGLDEYLEDLVARIDSPQLSAISVIYMNPPVDFPVTQLVEFVDRSVGPRSTVFRRAQVEVRKRIATFTLYDAEYPRRDPCSDWPPFTRDSEAIYWQVTHMAQVLSQVSATLSNVVHLELYKGPHHGCMDTVEWQRLLRQFSAVQTLKVGWGIAECMARTLEDLTEERVVGLFPFLELICLQSESALSIEKFVALRELSGHPVTVVDSEEEFDKRLESYIK
jgi:hypothetical protein